MIDDSNLMRCLVSLAVMTIQIPLLLLFCLAFNSNDAMLSFCSLLSFTSTHSYRLTMDILLIFVLIQLLRLTSLLFSQLLEKSIPRQRLHSLTIKL